MNSVITALTLLIAHCACLSFPNVYPRIKLEAKNYGDAGEPLFLSPYLKNGSISAAQNLSRVLLTEEIGIKSYSWFFTVNEDLGSNHFFWYFPPVSRDAKAPVILWLQGGPGASSLFGLFTELGPIVAEPDRFNVRKYHWALNHHVIFIDNPVGTGFSFTNNEKGYCNDETSVGRDLYNSLDQFYQMFPHLRSNEFYIAGESYAGKYIPALAIKIHEMNAAGHTKINLQGLAIGNGYCDPINQMGYGQYLYQHGLLGGNQLTKFEALQNKVIALIRREKWELAAVALDLLMDGSLQNFSYFHNMTGFDYYYNYLQTEGDDMSVFADILGRDEVRRAVHVGRLPFNDGSQVQLHLIKDLLKSVAPLISTLLSHYRVMTYNGQLDIVVAYPLTENFLKNLPFQGDTEYKTAERHVWRVDGDIAGYAKTAGNLTEVLVRSAGHMVPHDQPKWALDLITRFTRRKSFW